MTPTPHPLLPMSLFALAASAGLAQSADQAVLGGPKVKPREVPGVQEQYVPGDLGRFASRERPTPLPVFIQELRAIAAPDAPAEIRLTAEQSDAIRAELRDFAHEAGEFLKSHGDEIRQLVADLPRDQRPRVAAELGGLQRATELLDRIDRAGGLGAMEPRPGRRPRQAGDEHGGNPREGSGQGFRLRFDQPAPEDSGGSEDAMMQDEPGKSAAVQRLQALRDAAPSVSATETRIWQSLTQAQRDHVGAAIDEVRAVESRRLEEARLERIKNERGATESPKENATDLSRAAMERLLGELESGTIPDDVWSRLPQRARERLGALPEGERAEALQRFLRVRLKNESTEAPTGKNKVKAKAGG